MNKYIIHGSLLLVTLLIQCGMNVAGNGGGATETTNGRILCAAGKPASGAMVRLIDVEQWNQKTREHKSVVLDSCTTDENGGFSFSRDAIMEVNLQVNYADESILLRDYQFVNETTNVELKKSASIKGTFLKNTNKPVMLNLFGTSYEAVVDDDNSFSFAGIPPADYHVSLNIDNSNFYLVDSITLSEGQNITDYTMINDIVLQIDDFSSNNFYDSCLTKIGQKNGGFWFILNKELLGNSIAQEYAINEVTPQNDYYLFYKTSIPDTTPFSRGIGCMLAKDSLFDLSRSYKVSFCIKGHGNLRVVFYSKKIDTSGSASTAQYGKTIYLDSLSKDTMNCIDIECDSLDLEWSSKRPLGNGNGPRRVALEQIYRIDFVFSSINNTPGESVWMNIDDFIIEKLEIPPYCRWP